MRKAFEMLVVLQFMLVTVVCGQVKTQVMYSGNVKQAEETEKLMGKGVHQFEMEVMPIYGELFVTSNMPDSANHTRPSFTDAYIKPLFEQFQKNNGKLDFGDGKKVFLILNIAFEPQKVFQILRSQLAPVHDMLTYKSEGEWHQGPVQLLITDETLKSRITKNDRVLTGVVGKLADAERTFNNSVMPLIEVEFSELTTWNGFGNIPFEEYMKIKNTLARIHKSGKMLCVSNCPKSEDAWEVLTKANVDFISTIYAEELQTYINTKNKTTE